MENTHLLLLSEADESTIVYTLCDILGIVRENKPILVVNETAYQISFCVVSSAGSAHGADFFNRQMLFINEYFRETETSHTELKNAVLQQIAWTSSLVIITCVYEDDSAGLAFLVLEIAEKLLHQFCGLYLSESGKELYDEHLNLVFSDKAQTKVPHFTPCKKRHTKTPGS